MPVNDQAYSLKLSESEIWERLQTVRRQPVDAEWLANQYSPALTRELRNAIAEQLGLKEQQGWQHIQQLIERYGLNRELIQAAGLSHQKKAYEWLLSLIENQKEHDLHADIGEAIACWGADIPENILVQFLSDHGERERIAGLTMLRFRSHLLSAESLLNYCEHALTDDRETIVVTAIRLLQRRDEAQISQRLSRLCHERCNNIAKAALKALGCINNCSSQHYLKQLSKDLASNETRDLAAKQLNQQYQILLSKKKIRQHQIHC